MSLRQWSVTARRPVLRELRELGRPESRSRTGAFQIAKATLAAIVAWYIAAIVIGSGSAWLAPMTAVLMVQSTVYRSVSAGVRRVAAVTVGVVIAATAGNLVGLNALGLLLVVPLSLLFARLRWISAQGEYIAITAVLLLTFGVSTNEFYLVAYVRDTAVGCVIGAVVNALLFPPAYQRSARAAVSDLAIRTAQLLRELAEGASSRWSVEDAEQWRQVAEGLDAGAQVAQSALGWSQEAQRWNPWTSAASGRSGAEPAVKRPESRRTQRRATAYPAERYQPALDTLWHIVIEMRALTRRMQESAPQSSIAPALSQRMGPLLEAVAEVIETFGEDPVLHDGLGRQAATRLDHADECYQNLARDLANPVITDPEALEASGSMLWLLRRILRHLRDLGQR